MMAIHMPAEKKLFFPLAVDLEHLEHLEHHVVAFREFTWHINDLVPRLLSFSTYIHWYIGTQLIQKPDTFI